MKKFMRGASSRIAEEETDEITPEELKARFDAGDTPVLLDVRQDWEVQICRLEGALHIPMGELGRRLEELSRQDEIVVYCHHGGRSAAVTGSLRKLGFGRVKNLVGGIDRWTREIDPALRLY